MKKVWITKSIESGKLVWTDGRDAGRGYKPAPAPAPKPVKLTGAKVVTTLGSFHDAIRSRLTWLGAQVQTPRDFADLRDMYSWSTHVLLPGGADIHPHYYGEPPDAACGHTNPVRDMMESWLADNALRHGKPLFGICRGHQMITVMAGGTLHQDFPSIVGVSHDMLHPIAVAKRSPLYSIMGEKPTVNSYHHQATNVLPHGWKVGAYGPGKVIESIYAPGRPVLSVQWHPEAMHTNGAIELFKLWLSWKGEK